MTEESKEIIDIMKNLFNSLSSEIRDVKNASDVTNERLTKLEMTVENSNNRNIQLLAEGFGSLADKVSKLDDVQEDLKEMKTEMSLMKDIISGHSGEINKLAKVK